MNTDPITLWTSPNGKWRINRNMRAYRWRSTGTDTLGNPIGYWDFPQYQSDLPAYVQHALSDLWSNQKYTWTERYPELDATITRYAPTHDAAMRLRNFAIGDGATASPIVPVDSHHA